MPVTANPYVDTDITYDELVSGPLPSQPAPTSPRARSTEMKQEDADDVEGRVVDTSTLVAQDPVPHAPRFPMWDDERDRARDVYDNEGATGQAAFKNQG